MQEQNKTIEKKQQQCQHKRAKAKVNHYKNKNTIAYQEFQLPFQTYVYYNNAINNSQSQTDKQNEGSIMLVNEDSQSKDQFLVNINDKQANPQTNNGLNYKELIQVIRSYNSLKSTNLCKQQINSFLRVYFEKQENKTIQTISQQYFNKYYCKIKKQQFQETLFIEKEKRATKLNHIQTIQALLQQINANQNIQRIITDTDKALKIKTQQNTNKQKNFKDSLTINKKGTPINKKGAIVPFLNINQILHLNGKNEQKKYQNQNSYSAQQRPFTTKRQRKGRNYYYQDRNKQIKHVSNADQRLRLPFQVQTNSLNKKLIYESSDSSSLTQNPKQISMCNKYNENNHQKEQILKQKVATFNNQRVQWLQQFKEEIISKIENKYSQKVANTKTERTIQTEKQRLKISQQYKSKLHQVQLYQIQHLKKCLDNVNVQASELEKQLSEKYKNQNVLNKMVSLNFKKKQLKNKLKKAITGFWQGARTAN